MKTMLTRGRLLGSPLWGLWANSFIFASKQRTSSFGFKGLMFNKTDRDGSFFSRAKEFRQACRLVLREGFTLNRVNSSARLLSVSPAMADTLRKVFTSPKLVSLLKEQFLRHDLIYPGEKWNLNVMEMVESWRVSFQNVRSILILTHSHLHYLPKSEVERGTLFENERGLIMGVDPLNAALQFRPLSYPVETTGAPGKPKSLENDFFVRMGNQKVPLKDFLDKHYPFERKATPDWGNKYSVECGAEVALHARTGEVDIISQGTTKVTVIDKTTRRIAQLEHGRSYRDLDDPNVAESPSVFEYHFHPDYLEPTFSPVDVYARVEALKQKKIPRFLPHMIINIKREGIIYIPKTNNIADLEKISKTGMQLNTNSGNPEKMEKWRSHLREYFHTVRVRFNMDGEIEGWEYN
jgi:hypothetical protein